MLETTAWIKTLKNKADMRAAAYGVVKMIQVGMAEIQKIIGRVKGVRCYNAACAKEGLAQLPLSDSKKTDILNGPTINMKDTGKMTWPQ